MKIIACVLLLLSAHQLPPSVLAATCFAVGCIGIATVRPGD